MRLARRVGHDADATAALAEVYAELRAEDRLRLASALESDLSAEGIDPSTALATLVAAEHDEGIVLALVERIAHRICDPIPEAFALETGDRDRGGVALMIPEGSCWSALRVHWGLSDDGGAPRDGAGLRRVRDASDAASFLGELDVESRPREIPVTAGVDVAAEVLWRVRRRGDRLPEGAQRFAPLFRP